MDIKQAFYHIIFPFSITHCEGNHIIVDGTLSTDDKVAAIFSGIFFGLIGAGVGGAIAFYALTYHMRKQRFKELKNPKFQEDERVQQRINTVTNRIGKFNENLRTGRTTLNLPTKEELLKKNQQSKNPQILPPKTFQEILDSDLPAQKLFAYAVDPSFNQIQRFELYKMAADKGFVPAMIECAAILRTGVANRIPANIQESIRYLEKAAASDKAEKSIRLKIYSHLGNLYLFGRDGVIQNHETARQYFLKALSFGSVGIELDGIVHVIRKPEELDEIFQ